MSAKRDNMLKIYALTSALLNPTDENIKRLYGGSEENIGTLGGDIIVPAMREIADTMHEALMTRGFDNQMTLQELINIPHPFTGLNMLDYCLLMGCRTLALNLAMHGARSQYMQAFYDKLLSVFPDEDRPKIVTKICDIIVGVLLFNYQYEKIAYVGKTMVPGVLSGFGYLFDKSNTSRSWFALTGACGSLLLAFLYPVIGGVGDGLLFTAIASSVAAYSIMYSGDQQPENRDGTTATTAASLLSTANIAANNDYSNKLVNTIRLVVLQLERYFDPSLISRGALDTATPLNRQSSLFNMQILSPTGNNSLFMYQYPNNLGGTTGRGAFAQPSMGLGVGRIPDITRIGSIGASFSTSFRRNYS